MKDVPMAMFNTLSYFSRTTPSLSKSLLRLVGGGAHTHTHLSPTGHCQEMFRLRTLKSEVTVRTSIFDGRTSNFEVGLQTSMFDREGGERGERRGAHRTLKSRFEIQTSKFDIGVLS